MPNTSQQQLPTGTLNTEEINERLKGLGEAQSGQKKQLNWMRIAIIGVLVVVSLGFLELSATVYGIIQTELINKAATFQNLVDKINEQNIKMDSLLDEVRELREVEKGTIQKPQ